MKIKVHQKPKIIKLTLSRIVEMMMMVCDDLNLADGEINLVFTGDESMAALHREYFDDHTPTDVITFNLSDDHFEGEIYIGWQAADEQARYYKVSLEDEICRLMIHGVLHLKGMKDDTKIQQANMKAEEDRLLKTIKTQIV